MAHVNPLFHLPELRRTRVFSEWEHGLPARWACIRSEAGDCGTRRRTAHDQRKKICGTGTKPYLRSRLSLTDFGKAVVAHKEDFSRHNPIDRWWGGTHLTNDRLWRWNPALMKP